MTTDDGAATGSEDTGWQDGAKSAEVDVVPLPEGAPSHRVWARLLAGPTIWVTHFMVVYLLAEALCAAGGPGDDVLGAPALVTWTLVATALAVAAITVTTVWAWRAWRRADHRASDEDPRGSEPHRAIEDRALAGAGALLGPLSILSVLLVGLSALWVRSC